MTESATTQYIPFARKYRPTNFSELYGQEVLVKILTHTIQTNRLAQGYLLTGIRGVGKTTSARIIAKTVNCENLIITEKAIKACQQCANCNSFNNHSHPDIIEIDAASKTSVDDIRRIIEISEYRPLLAKYKIFIIDEVHMLSKGAFNALLKILEEPPAHVIFIFATTEVQKIPLTVVSRCQRYDLRRLTFNEILGLLNAIAKKESLQFEPEALKIIALKSDGSARDAISMLDQSSNLTSSLGQQAIVTCETVNNMLGLVDGTTVIKFFEYIIARNTEEAIALINKLYMSSANLEIFIELVSDLIAYLSKIKMLPNYTQPIYELFSNEIKNILAKTNFSQLSILWQIYSKGIQEIKNSHNQLIEAEMLIIKSIYSELLPSLEELLHIDSTPKSKIPTYEISDFLEYLHINNEMDLYYLLLNQVEIKKFSDNILEIAGSGINVKTKEILYNLLTNWRGEKFKVLVTAQTEIITLKDRIIDKIKSEKDWELLKKHFPNAMISDILYKN